MSWFETLWGCPKFEIRIHSSLVTQKKTTFLPQTIMKTTVFDLKTSKQRDIVMP